MGTIRSRCEEGGEVDGATEEEIAAQLSQDEGRPVPVDEVGLIERQTWRKLRRILLARGRTVGNLLPEQ